MVWIEKFARTVKFVLFYQNYAKNSTINCAIVQNLYLFTEER